jgi:hypothetical protein
LGFGLLDYGPQPLADAYGTGPILAGTCPSFPPPPFPGPLPTSVGTAGEMLWPNGITLDTLAASATGCTSPCPTDWTITTPQQLAFPATAISTGDWAVGQSNGTIAVIDATTHTIKWTASTGATALDQPLAATPSTIYAVAGSTVAAFPATGCAASTCTPSWTATLASGTSARPSIGGDVLYVGSPDGTITALPADGCGMPTCAPLWSHNVGSPIAWTVIDNGILLVGSTNGTITAFQLP